MKTSRKKTPAAREERRHGAFLSFHTFEENCGGDNFTASLKYLHRCLRRCRANYIKFFFFWQGCFSVLFSFNSNKWTALCDLPPLSLLAASGSAPCAGTLANEDQHRWRKLISFNSVRASWDRKKVKHKATFEPRSTIEACFMVIGAKRVKLNNSCVHPPSKLSSYSSQRLMRCNQWGVKESITLLWFSSWRFRPEAEPNRPEALRAKARVGHLYQRSALSSLCPWSFSSARPRGYNAICAAPH